MVVDDETYNLGVIKLVFEFHQSKVLVATSDPECLEILEVHQSTVILINIHVPQMSDYELLRRIRARDEWKIFPLIAVRAHALDGDAHKIREAGFGAYIPKPINVMSLAQEVEHIMNTLV